MRRVLALTLSLFLVIALTGCVGGPPSDPAQIRGVITSVSEGPNGVLSLRVVWDGSLGAQLQYDAAQVAVTPKTHVYATSTGKPSDAVRTSSAQLRVRDIVEAWFTGAVRESYPPQVSASDILVLGRWDAGRPLPTPPGLTPPPQ